MDGTQYVIEQLGQALKASHEVIAQQAQQIADLQALVRQALNSEDAEAGLGAEANPAIGDDEVT